MPLSIRASKKLAAGMRCLAKAAVLAGSTALLTACGGSGGATSTDVSERQLRQGRFVDAPVANLDYSAGAITGVTDQGGYFLYEEQGQTVTFYLGGVAIGSAPASEVVHILDLSSAAGAIGDNANIRLAQLLQTLDQDQDASNGIQISDSTKSVVIAQGAPDLTSSSSAWATYLGAISARLGRPAVTPEAALAHAVASMPADAVCPVQGATYPLADIHGLGTFSTAGRSCKHKAQATAFYHDVLGDMTAREGEIRQSEVIANGASVAQRDVEALISQNIVANAMDWLGSLMEVEQLNGLTSNKDRTLRLLSVSTGVLQKSADLLLAFECEGELPCKDQQQSSLKAASVVLDVMARSAACTSADLARCAETLKSSIEVLSYFKITFGRVSLEQLGQFADLFVAWAVPAIDLVTSVDQLDRAKVLQVSGSFADAAIKTHTGFYLRSADEVANRNGWLNTLEILGEAIKVGADCAVRTLEHMKTCVGSVTAYVNRRASEIFVYAAAIDLADSTNFDADSIAAASVMISEILRHDGLYAALGHYGVPWPGADGPTVNAALSQLAWRVSSRARLTPTSTAMMLLGDYSKAVDYYRLYWSAVESSASALLAGRTTTCASVSLGPLRIQVPGGATLAAVNQAITLTVPVVSTAPLQGFIVDAGDGSVGSTPDSVLLHAYAAAGRYKVRATPVVRTPNGGLVACETRATTGVVTVAAGTQPPVGAAPTVASLNFMPTEPARLEVHFDQPMQPTFFTVGGYVPASSVWESSTKFVVTFSRYSPGGTITLKAPTASDPRGFRSAAGVALATDHVFQFPGTEPPVGIAPVATNLNFVSTVPPRLEVTFDRPMQPTYGTTGNYVPASSVWESSTKFVITFSSFTPGGSITLRAGSFISTTGAPMASDVTYQFPANSGALLARWTFDDCTGADSSGNGRNAMLNGGPACVAGRVGNALRFSGIDVLDNAVPQWLELPVNPGPALTFAAWFKWEPTTGYRSSGGNESIWAIGDTQTDTHSTGIWISGPTRSLFAYGTGEPAATAVPGQWMHVAFTSDGNVSRLYVNGEYVHKVVYATPINLTGQRQFISSFERQGFPTTRQVFSGLIDDARLYDKVLSAEEVRSVYIGN